MTLGGYKSDCGEEVQFKGNKLHFFQSGNFAFCSRCIHQYSVPEFSKIGRIQDLDVLLIERILKIDR